MTPYDGSVDPDGLAHPEFLPDPSLSRGEMEALQRELAGTARFVDDHALDPESVAVGTAFDLSGGLPPASPDAGDPDAPVVVGIDQAFRSAATEGETTEGNGAVAAGENGNAAAGENGDEGEAVSAAVAIRDGEVVEYAAAATPPPIPYVPGLLAFREGGPILAALDALSVAPDLLVLDGSGRIHFREAGIATHVGVVHDLPSIGVAKRLLCGKPDEPVGERAEGWRTPIRAGGSIPTVNGHDTIVGYAFQSRQYPNSRRVNPLYVSPGHRVSASTALDLVEAMCAGYKLPEPTRIADAYADVIKRTDDVPGS